ADSGDGAPAPILEPSLERDVRERRLGEFASRRIRAVGNTSGRSGTSPSRRARESHAERSGTNAAAPEQAAIDQDLALGADQPYGQIELDEATPASDVCQPGEPLGRIVARGPRRASWRDHEDQDEPQRRTSHYPVPF